MGLLARYNSLNRIFISAAHYQQKQMPEGKEGVLFCDSKGKLTPAIIEISLAESAENAVKQWRYEGKLGAAVCIEITPGKFATFPVEITAEQSEALIQIRQFASEAGIIRDYLKIPDHLKKYPAQIIKRGEKAIERTRKGQHE
jgi:hypothetical protein